jgi:hypothetical protein
MVEFTVVFVAILLPALMAIFEFAQLSVAKQNLRYAVFDMVRRIAPCCAHAWVELFCRPWQISRMAVWLHWALRRR